MTERKNEKQITMEDVLSMREERVRLQQEMLNAGKCPIISFSLNIPGPVKTSPEFQAVFEYGIEKIWETVRRNVWIVVCELECRRKAGYEFFMGVDAPEKAVKQAMTDIEDKERTGRLFDIDVIGLNGQKISRTEIGKSERKCMICDRPAYECARSRKHSVEELLTYIAELLHSERGL